MASKPQHQRHGLLGVGTLTRLVGWGTGTLSALWGCSVSFRHRPEHAYPFPIARRRRSTSASTLNRPAPKRTTTSGEHASATFSS